VGQWQTGTARGGINAGLRVVATKDWFPAILKVNSQKTKSGHFTPKSVLGDFSNRPMVRHV
jgi:hypothetical protein